MTSAAAEEPMSPTVPPTLDEFLAWPIADVRAVAPETLFYAPGGSRRSAVFHGIKPWTSDYFEWGIARTLECIRIIFEHGVRNVFLPLYMSGHIREYDGSALHLTQLVMEYIAGPSKLATYREHNWRVRLINIGGGSLLADAADALAQATDQAPHAETPYTLWYMTSESADTQWQAILAAAKDATVLARQDAVRALYGEDVAPVALYLGFGKPMVNGELFPPLLVDEVQCYWSQQAGYGLDARQFRKILYDYHFLRPTWRRDKTSRAETASTHRELWESDFVLGVGRRVGSFWYPDLTGYPAEHLP